MKISYLSSLFLILIILSACGDGTSLQDPELKQFDDVKVTTFKKNTVEIQTTMRYYNPNDFSIMVTAADFDILVNEKDVGTFMTLKSQEVKAGALIEIPVKITFEPEKAFTNFETGLIKIKSDHVANVSMNGYLTVAALEQEETVNFEMEQLVLFTNDGSLSLDESGNIIEE